MERHPASWPHERRGLGNDLLWLRNVDQHEARDGEIEGALDRPADACVPFEHLDVAKAAFRNECSGQGHRVRAPLDAHHAARWPNPFREQLETSVRAAADLDDPRTGRHVDLIEQPARLVGELLRLLLQSRLFRLSVAQHVPGRARSSGSSGH